MKKGIVSVIDEIHMNSVASQVWGAKLKLLHVVELLTSVECSRGVSRQAALHDIAECRQLLESIEKTINRKASA